MQDEMIRKKDESKYLGAIIQKYNPPSEEILMKYLSEKFRKLIFRQLRIMGPHLRIVFTFEFHGSSMIVKNEKNYPVIYINALKPLYVWVDKLHDTTTPTELYFVRRYIRFMSDKFAQNIRQAVKTAFSKEVVEDHADTNTFRLILENKN